MNRICRTCNTRLKLGLCFGRDGMFKYCFRRCGSLIGIKDTITTFSTISELYEKCEWLRNNTIEQYTTFNPNDSYFDEHMCYLFGIYNEDNAEENIKNNHKRPIGYIMK